MCKTALIFCLQQVCIQARGIRFGFWRPQVKVGRSRQMSLNGNCWNCLIMVQQMFLRHLLYT